MVSIDHLWPEVDDLILLGPMGVDEGEWDGTEECSHRPDGRQPPVISFSRPLPGARGGN